MLEIRKIQLLGAREVARVGEATKVQKCDSRRADNNGEEILKAPTKLRHEPRCA
jgi:hypothetical protein